MHAQSRDPGSHIHAMAGGSRNRLCAARILAERLQGFLAGLSRSRHAVPPSSPPALEPEQARTASLARLLRSTPSMWTAVRLTLESQKTLAASTTARNTRRRGGCHTRSLRRTRPLRHGARGMWSRSDSPLGLEIGVQNGPGAGGIGVEFGPTVAKSADYFPGRGLAVFSMQGFAGRIAIST